MLGALNALRMWNVFKRQRINNRKILQEKMTLSDKFSRRGGGNRERETRDDSALVRVGTIG